MSCILTAIRKDFNMFCVYAYMRLAKYEISNCKRFANCRIFEISNEKNGNAFIKYFEFSARKQDSTDCGTCVQFCARNEKTWHTHRNIWNYIVPKCTSYVACISYMFNVQVFTISSLIVWNRTRPFRSFNMENGTKNRKVKELTL